MYSCVGGWPRAPTLHPPPARPALSLSLPRPRPRPAARRPHPATAPSLESDSDYMQIPIQPPFTAIVSQHVIVQYFPLCCGLHARRPLVNSSPLRTDRTKSTFSYWVTVKVFINEYNVWFSGYRRQCFEMVVAVYKKFKLLAGIVETASQVHADGGRTLLITQFHCFISRTLSPVSATTTWYLRSRDTQ